MNELLKEYYNLSQAAKMTKLRLMELKLRILKEVPEGAEAGEINTERYAASVWTKSPLHQIDEYVLEEYLKEIGLTHFYRPVVDRTLISQLELTDQQLRTLRELAGDPVVYLSVRKREALNVQEQHDSVC